MEQVRARFFCSGVYKDENGTTLAKLYAVCDDGQSEENKSFAESTPSGNVDLVVSNPAAAGFFQAGRSYYLDFTPAS